MQSLPLGIKMGILVDMDILSFPLDMNVGLILVN